MKKIIEDLWYSYITNCLAEQTVEEKKILSKLVKYESNLHSKLSEEQKNALKNYENCLDELNDISTKDAFIKGIRFATIFLIEALYTEC